MWRLIAICLVLTIAVTIALHAGQQGSQVRRPLLEASAQTQGPVSRTEGLGLVALPGLNSAGPDLRLSISGDGRFIAFQSDRPGGTGAEDVYLYDRERGALVPLPRLNSPGPDFSPSLSADAMFIAFARAGTRGQAAIYLYDLTAKVLLDLPGFHNGADENFPVLSADGRFILYRAVASSGLGLRLYDRNIRAYVGIPELDTDANEDAGTLSTDGRMIAFFRENRREFLGDFLFDRQTGRLEKHGHRVTGLGSDGRVVVALDVGADFTNHLYLYDRGSQRRIPVSGLDSPQGESGGNLSQDGRYLVFVSFRNGQGDVFLYRTRP